MTMSVHTNSAAMIALQNLNKTTEEMEMTQSRINTGLKIGGSKDNASIYAVAQAMRADVRALDAVQSGLDRASTIGDVALAAGEAISKMSLRTVVPKNEFITHNLKVKLEFSNFQFQKGVPCKKAPGFGRG